MPICPNVSASRTINLSKATYCLRKRGQPRPLNPYKANFSFCTNQYQLSVEPKQQRRKYRKKQFRAKRCNANYQKRKYNQTKYYQIRPQVSGNQANRVRVINRARKRKRRGCYPGMRFNAFRNVREKLLGTNKNKRRCCKTLWRKPAKDEVKFIETVIERVATTRRIRNLRLHEKEMYLVYKNKLKRSKSSSELANRSKPTVHKNCRSISLGAGLNKFK